MKRELISGTMGHLQAEKAIREGEASKGRRGQSPQSVGASGAWSEHPQLASQHLTLEYGSLESGGYLGCYGRPLLNLTPQGVKRRSLQKPG